MKSKRHTGVLRMEQKFDFLRKKTRAFHTDSDVFGFAFFAKRQ